MSLTDNEKEKLRQVSAIKWAESSRMNYLNSDWGEGSYYGVPDDTFYLEEYQFETPLELRGMLEQFFSTAKLPDELVPVVTAAVFKLKDRVKDEGKLMETIYNF